ncbi:hypothetical protein O3P69_008993 [Scylla paramamosain]|uniref:Endonuclease/exonuclease/phosphatase domain-containing protein n=1 Tax=Scylla paramamosain TaxID=85552 RepID=A0AAW0TRL9_SCYPA
MTEMAGGGVTTMRFFTGIFTDWNLTGKAGREVVRKDIPATPIHDPPALGEQADSLCVTLHLSHVPATDVYNAYCRHRSNLNLFPLLENNDGRPVLLRGDFNAHHPLLEARSGGVNQRGRHITQLLEDFPAAVLHGEPHPTHITGGRLNLTIMMNGDGQDVQVTPVPDLLSDHWAQVNLHTSKQSGTARTTERRWDTRKANWKTFTDLLSTCTSDLQSGTCRSTRGAYCDREQLPSPPLPNSPLVYPPSHSTTTTTTITTH